jgi:hypothetical protein
MVDQRDAQNPFDVTSELRSVERLLAVHRGLYVQYLENSGAEPIYDRNRGGKLLVRPGGTTIKIGKFENGFLARRSQDAVHMHRRPADMTEPHKPYCEEFGYAPALGTYMECLRRVYLLNLGSSPKEVVRRAEKELRTDVDKFLRSRGLNVENSRGDWRLVIESGDIQGAVDAWVRSEFNTLSARYAVATSEQDARVLRRPGGAGS